MMNLEKLALMYQTFIETAIPILANGYAKFALISDPGSLAGRTFDWGGDLENYECNFDGYEQVTADAGGTGSAWLPMVTNALTEETQAIEVTFAYDSAEPHVNTRQTPKYVVYLGYHSGDSGPKVINLWECPTPVTFNADGVEHTWSLKLFDVNIEDV